MKRKLVNVLAWIGGITVLLTIGAAMAAMLFAGKEEVPDRTVLKVDFRQRMVEYVPDHPLARITQARVLALRDVVEALERAAEDDRVVGLFARVGGSRMGPGDIQEVRDAVLAFREKGKPTVAYAETFGDFGAGNGAYYLATAFEKVYLQPSGDVGLTGLIYEHPFVKGTLEKLGLTYRLEGRHEYKNAINLFTERSFTDAHREATEGIMMSHLGQIARGIAESLSSSEAEVRALMDRGPFMAEEAEAAGLVAGLAYWDEVDEKVKAMVGEEAEFLSLKTYLDRAGRPHSKGAGVALIYGVGPVMRGKSDYDAASGNLTMGSDTVTEAFRDAVEDGEVKAILFRVNSPGGSYVASDAIWRETVRAREAGKPVVVSMGNVAGSGGYFVAMDADKIVAQPGTITGSIGVYGGKMLTSRFWEKLGVSWDEVHAGKNATMWTGTQDFTPEQWTRFQARLDRVYDDFTGKVARGRKLPNEQVHKAARGRIWTGEDALALGLVDTLGGFSTALKLVREEIDLPEGAPVKLKVFPREKSFVEVLLEQGLEARSGQATADLAVRLLEEVRPVLRLVRSAGLGGERGVLRMPEVGSGW